jgi:hypothetical protein
LNLETVKKWWFQAFAFQIELVPLRRGDADEETRGSEGGGGGGG